MKTYVKLVLTATLTVFATAAVAGKSLCRNLWKFDASKSKITQGQTVAFTAESAGTIQITQGGQSYSFKPDGSTSKTPFGGTVVWTKIRRQHLEGREIHEGLNRAGHRHLEVGGRSGKSVAVSSTGTKPNGDSFSESETLVRVTTGTRFLRQVEEYEGFEQRTGYQSDRGQRRRRDHLEHPGNKGFAGTQIRWKGRSSYRSHRSGWFDIVGHKDQPHGVCNRGKDERKGRLERDKHSLSGRQDADASRQSGWRIGAHHRRLSEAVS